MADTPTTKQPTKDELFIKALEQICYNQTGLDVTIGQIRDLVNQANQPVTPTDSTSTPTA